MKKLKIPTKSTYFTSDTIAHTQMFEELMQFAMKSAKVVGGHIFDPNFVALNPAFIFAILLQTLTTIITIYDIYLFRDNLVRCAFCLLTLSAAVQGYAKMYTFVFLRYEILDLRKSTEKLQRNFNTLRTSRIFEDCFLKTAHVGAVLTILFIATAILFTTYPIIYYIVFRERILHFGIELPFLEWQTSWIDYGINFVHQSLCINTFICGSIATIVMGLCFVTNAIAQYDVIGLLLDDLDELAIANEEGSKVDEIKEMIKLIVEMHIELNEFLNLLQDIFRSYYFFDFAALIFMKTVSLFAVITVSVFKAHCA
jgi:hypothetical protein